MTADTVLQWAEAYCTKKGLPLRESLKLYDEFDRMEKIIIWGNEQPEAVLRAVLQSKLDQQTLLEIFEEFEYIE